MALLAGMTGVRAVDDAATEIAKAVQADIEAKAGQKFEKFVPVAFATQASVMCACVYLLIMLDVYHCCCLIVVYFTFVAILLYLCLKHWFIFVLHRWLQESITFSKLMLGLLLFTHACSKFVQIS